MPVNPLSSWIEVVFKIEKPFWCLKHSGKQNSILESINIAVGERQIAVDNEENEGTFETAISCAYNSHRSRHQKFPLEKRSPFLK